MNEHDILQKIGPILLSPRMVPSRAELAKRAKLTDEMLSRFANRFELDRGFAFYTVENGKVRLTEKGHVAYGLYLQLWELGKTDDQTSERLRIQAEPILAARLLPAALLRMFQSWGSVIERVSIWNHLDGEIRRNIEEGGKTDLGLGFADADDSVNNKEVVGKVEWCILAPADHVIGKTEGPVSADELPKDFWLLLPDLNGVSLANFFAEKGHRQIIETDHLSQYAAVVGVAAVPDVLGTPRGTIKRKLTGLSPLTVRLFLPRGGESKLSSPNQALVENLRLLMQEGLSDGDNGIPASAPANKLEAPQAKPGADALGESTVTPLEEVLS